eukprot:TRINITY_DN1255_c0_g1_i5.p1 TRINITY_DN1255_c0_g1~~TRINITY_DN1255_c0_g1_i5.p1  ORF type:complete len:406 (-),score=164.50 TRINITY_DN1255_c0_g1_i5:181-1398(-)
MVLDASAPYYIEEIEKYLCVLKLIDETVNPQFKGKAPYISLTCFSKNKAELPKITRMGCVIRIHRGDTKKFNKSYQLNCDVGIKGAWVLFDPSETIKPMAHTGRAYTFVEEDKKKLKDIRKFGEKFLKENDAGEFASIGANVDEIDLVGLVLSRKSADKNMDKLTVFDGEEFVKLEIDKARYTHISPQDIVRVRGLRQKRNEFLVNDYTNIMKIDKDQAAAKELKKKIDKAKKDKKLSGKLDIYIPTIEKSKTVSEVIAKKTKSISLKDLFSLETSKLKGQKYSVSVNVVEIGPKDPKSWIVTVDSKARKQYDLSSDIKHYYRLQLFTKDATNSEDHNVYPLYLCNIDGRGNEFFPDPDDADTPKELKRIYKTITKPWFVLNLALEPVVSEGKSVFFIVDTKLTL